MFLNHRPLLVLLLFLAASPVDVVSRVVYSEYEDTDGYPSNRTLAADPLQLDVNPLHLLCPVCSLLQFLLGGVLGTVLGGGLLQNVGIVVLGAVFKSFIHLPIVPVSLAAAIIELLPMIGKKVGGGICPLLLLCPMPKQKAKPSKSPILSAVDEYEDKIAHIIENRDSANLSPEMENLYVELSKLIPAEYSSVENEARHVLRNFVAAIQYHSAHREEYLAITSLNL